MKQATKWCYQRLPFSLAKALAKGRPNLAFYIRPGPRRLLLNGYLGQFTVQLDTVSDIERRMLSGTYEPTTQAIVARFLKPGQQALDIGANVGAIAMALAKAVGPTGRVDAFEPGPPIFEKLQENIRLNPQLTHLHTHRLGLADQGGELRWQVSQNDPGNATMLWTDDTRPTTVVTVTTIDEFVRTTGIAAIHFVKIDVEGMELKVMRGGAESIRRHLPAIYFESSLCDDEQRASVQEIERFLGEMGYRLYRVENHGAIVGHATPI